MVFASSSVLMVEGAPPSGGARVCAQDELQLPPASPRDSPRSAGGSDPGSFEITASALGPGAGETLHVCCKSESLFPTALPKLSSMGFQSQMF